MPKIKIVYNQVELLIDTNIIIEKDDVDRIVKLMCSDNYGQFKTGYAWLEKRINEKNVDSFLPTFEEKLINKGFLSKNNVEKHLWRLEILQFYKEKHLSVPLDWMPILESTHLDVYAQDLSRIPESIQYLEDLQHLQFYDNRIMTLPKGIFKLKKLEFLGLQNNSIHLLGSEINELDSLQILFVGNNKLSYVSERIGELKHLQMIYLNNNNLTRIPNAIGDCHNLSFINLSYNELKILPDSILNLTSLQHLILTNNPLPQAYVTDLSEAMPWCKIQF